MEKNIEISILLDIYGKLLTEKQYSLLDDYYNKDYSLSEIAENLGITRQAVRDNLKKGELNLYELEEKLLLLKKAKSQEKLLKDILEKVDDKNIQKEIKKLIANLY